MKKQIQNPHKSIHELYIVEIGGPCYKNQILTFKRVFSMFDECHKRVLE